MELINKTEWLSKPRCVCGIMTGTSVDAVDVAIAQFSSGNGIRSYEIKATGVLEIPDDIMKLIIKIISSSVLVSDISMLNFALSKLFADAVKKVCNENDFPLKDIEAIGIHGQTIWHDPNGKTISGYSVSSTLQSGSVSSLAKLLNLPVVGDFRSADIALGGQGAPLVPIFDYEFLRDKADKRIILNIGGISNITILPANCTRNEVKAFDTGPGNVFIDFAVQKYFQKQFDKNGDIARSGENIPALLDKLMSLSFINIKPPKSTGRELFSKEYFNNLCDEYANVNNKEDIVRTFTEFTARSIALNIKLYAENSKLVIASGGGSDNSFLIGLLRELTGIPVEKSDKFGIPSDYKEALCFAYLAYLTLGGLPGNIPSVTGALKDTILGVIALP